MASGERKEINLTALVGLISAIVIVTTLITSPMLSATAVKDNGNRKSKAENTPKPTKCNNVKMLLKVSSIPRGTTSLHYSVTLLLPPVPPVVTIAAITLEGNKASDKLDPAEPGIGGNGSKFTIPVLFKKLDRCASVGNNFFGSVNGTDFSGRLASLNKPNKINVVLS